MSLFLQKIISLQYKSVVSKMPEYSITPIPLKHDESHTEITVAVVSLRPWECNLMTVDKAQDSAGPSPGPWNNRPVSNFKDGC